MIEIKGHSPTFKISNRLSLSHGLFLTIPNDADLVEQDPVSTVKQEQEETSSNQIKSIFVGALWCKFAIYIRGAIFQ